MPRSIASATTSRSVSTTDFFPPLVDDPADFGAIAAANACSDVFAMGGQVVLAINVAAFPEDFPREAIAAIFAAGAATVAAAGGTVAGGHTIRNPEPIYGLAVQGVVHPDRVFRKSGALAGDVLMLSKPIGTGLALAGGNDADKQAAIVGMRQLNRTASEVLRSLGADVHAVTDVTGYGLAGHGWEMAERSQRPGHHRHRSHRCLPGRAGSGRTRCTYRWRSAQPRLRARPPRINCSAWARSAVF